MANIQVISDYIYRIHNKKTNKTYIGQTVRYEDSTRIHEHFMKTNAGEKSEASDVIRGSLLSDLEVEIFNGPEYGLTKQQFIDFLSYFWFAGKRLERTFVKTAASEQSAFYIGLDNQYLKQAYSMLTRGNIVDIAEILHISNAVEKGEIVVNRDMGGQQTA